MYTRFVLALALWLCVGEGFSHAEGSIVARVGQSGDFLDLEQSDGAMVRDYLPLYRAGGIRYFSCGVRSGGTSGSVPAVLVKTRLHGGRKTLLGGRRRNDSSLRREKRPSSFH